VTYRIAVAPSVLQALMALSDRRARDKISERIDQLAVDPEKQGKPLVGELGGYRSVRAVGQRYRIIYRIEKQQVIVFVVAVGLRKQGSKKDVYTLAKRLLRLRLIDTQD
jgi:mRNA interferase RelE/StbE